MLEARLAAISVQGGDGHLRDLTLSVRQADPDHSAKFWLSVRSLCPEMDRAKQWLSRHHAELAVNLTSIVDSESSIGDRVRP